MTKNQLSINIDESFVKQQKTIFSSLTNSPIPEAILYRTLRMAELAILKELKKKDSKSKLVAIQLECRIPKIFEKVNKEDLEEAYQNAPIYSVASGIPFEDEDDNLTNISSELLTDDFISQLIERVQESIEKQTPSELLEGLDLSVGLKLQFNSNIRRFLIFLKCTNRCTQKCRRRCKGEYRNRKFHKCHCNQHC